MFSKATNTLVPWSQFTTFVGSQMPLSLRMNKKKDLIQIQWFVAIASSYLLLVREGQLVNDPINLFLLMTPLGSILIFLRLPQSAFNHRLFPQVIAMTDTV